MLYIMFMSYCVKKKIIIVKTMYVHVCMYVQYRKIYKNNKNKKKNKRYVYLFYNIIML